MVRRSSAVEQLTVNQLVVGSIPTAGAIISTQANEILVFMGFLCLLGTAMRYRGRYYGGKNCLFEPI